MPFVGPLYYRDLGAGDSVPIVVLHGGWGYAFYPFDDAIAGLARRFVIPDRSGYGQSPPLAELPPNFHTSAAAETEGLLAALGITRCVLWGHSDGAVIAVILALRHPERYAGIIVEALHLDREKPRSRVFFEQMAGDPDAFGDRVTSRLATDHPDYRAVLRAGGRAWLAIARTPADDFYDGRLAQLSVPTLAIFGADDPRTEPDEVARLAAAVPRAELHVLPGAGHSPHSERGSAATCTNLARAFLDQIAAATREP
jgi:pimeloyl-ACP methyl ester carboxylesterase